MFEIYSSREIVFVCLLLLLLLLLLLTLLLVLLSLCLLLLVVVQLEQTNNYMFQTHKNCYYSLFISSQAARGAHRTDAGAAAALTPAPRGLVGEERERERFRYRDIDIDIHMYRHIRMAL